MEILDRLKVMKEQEATTYQCTDYLQNHIGTPGAIDDWCRFKMVEWCFQVVDFIGFSRETVCIAMSYLDRFLSNGNPRAIAIIRSRKDYQLAAMTSLYIAIKLFEPKVIGMSLLTELSRGCYDMDDFRLMEDDMLAGLNWRLNGPTPTSFMENFLSLLALKEPEVKDDYSIIIDNATYQIELSVGDYDFVTRHPSEIAIASLINSFRLLPNNERLMTSIQEIAGTNLNSFSMQLTARSMHRLQHEETPTLRTRRSTASQTYPDKDKKRMANTIIRTERTYSPTCVTK